MNQGWLRLELIYHRVGWMGLGGITLASLVQLGLTSPSPLFSLIIVILPYLYLLGGMYYAFGWCFQTLRPQLLIPSVTLALGGLLLWPPTWVFNRYFHSPPALSQTDHPFRVVSWNVKRMGELEKVKSLRARQKEYQKSLQCVSETLKPLSADFILLQEISKSRLHDLKKSLKLSCHHVDYYGTGRTHRGGLGICIPHQKNWKFNYVHDVRLPDRWRALLVEVESRSNVQHRFNLINVHFLPTGIGARDLKKAVNDLAQGSSKALGSLFSHLLDVLQRQEDQAQQLLEKMSRFKDPTILVGDFNSPPSTIVHQSLRPKWVDTWHHVGESFGATRYFGNWIPFRVDFIYSLAGAFIPRLSKVVGSRCSDHLPLFSDFTLNLSKKE